MAMASFLTATDPQVITVPDPDTVSPGFLGFVVIFVLAIATVLLVRSMVGHLRKVRYSPEPTPRTSMTDERTNERTTEQSGTV
jgi:hypothetical protein